MRTRADVLREVIIGGHIEAGGKKILLDEAGYLVNPDDWCAGFVAFCADDEGIELTSLHWEIFAEMRTYFELHHIAMDQRFILKYLARKFNTDKAGAKRILFEHFPYGYIKQAVKMAGMRQPRGWSTG